MTASMDHTPAQANNLRHFLVLTLGSVGVVYGDIGTSPLYAFREALRPFAAGGVERGEVIGLISLMLWTLTIIVTCKYVLFLLRADNDGDGGMPALLALLMKKAPRQTTIMLMAGIHAPVSGNVFGDPRDRFGMRALRDGAFDHGVIPQDPVAKIRYIKRCTPR